MLSWPVWLDTIEAAERIFGPAAAREMWRRSPLPQPTDIRLVELEFLSEACERKASARVGAAELHERYGAWCAARGLDALTVNSFGKALRTIGIARRKSDRIFYTGIQLRPIEGAR